MLVIFRRAIPISENIQRKTRYLEGISSIRLEFIKHLICVKSLDTFSQSRTLLHKTEKHSNSEIIIIQKIFFGIIAKYIKCPLVNSVERKGQKHFMHCIIIFANVQALYHDWMLLLITDLYSLSFT